MPAILIPILIALIESTPSLVAAIGKEWLLLKQAAAEGRDLTPQELISLSESAVLSAAALRSIVAQRVASGEWKE
jgi:hypothetical protein